MSQSTSTYIRTAHSTTAKRGLILSGLDRIVGATQDLVGGSSWRPFQNFAKSMILTLLSKIKQGRITLIIGANKHEVYEFGEPFTLLTEGVPVDLESTIRVLDESFWTRIFLHPEFGLADSYMLQLIDVESLSNVFKIYILNRKHLSEMHTLLSPLMNFFSYMANLRLDSSVTGSKSNISAHYDLPEELFTGFLSWDLTYSCAIFDEAAGGYTGDLEEDRPLAPPRKSWADERSMPPDDLERGQLAKLHLICRKARIRKGSRVLEIGCGWGSFAILAAGTYGAVVDTITISEHQKTSAEKIIAEAGLSNAITVHLLDYRDLPASFESAFDAVISIGVTEHVGLDFLDVWFAKISWAMKPENSYKVFTMSTIPDTKWDLYKNEIDFVRKYIYPGGALSSPKILIENMTKNGLNVESIDDLSPHYIRTSREWRRRFNANFDSHIKPGFIKHDPHLSDESIEIFRRKWDYYFAYCEAGFSLRAIYDQLFVCSRELNVLGYYS